MKILATLRKSILSPVQAFSVLVLTMSGLASFVHPVEAQYKVYTIDSLDVQIEVKADSSMKISEELGYTFNDEFNGMFREITLTDYDDLRKCRDNAVLQCGGFNFINIEKVYVDDEEIKEGRYEVSEVDNGTQKRLRVQYKFDGAPVTLDNERHTFRVEYEILGGIGYFDDYDLFYWNAIFEDRDRAIGKTKVSITYPGPVDLEQSSVLSAAAIDYEYNQVAENKIEYTTDNIPPYYDFTVLQKIDKGIITRAPALDLALDPTPLDLSFQKYKFEVEDGRIIEGLPSGKNTFEFSKFGYNSKKFTLDLKPGEVEELEVKLEMTLWMQIAIAALATMNCLLFALALFAPLGLYLFWRRKGRDKGKQKTIIPEFSPPDDIHPYLLGALKDEMVDDVDISATIIDLAYKGYLKIVENKGKLFSGKDYTLVKLKDFTDLNDVEQKIMTMIFESDDAIGAEVKMSSLKNKAYQSIPSIKSKIYSEMVSKGFFLKDPNSVRSTWLAIGIGVLVVGIVLSVIFSFTFIYTGFCLAISLGFGLMIMSGMMPAKTELGSETLWKIRGFKMYLETAEKYTLQNLTPELFEKYLSYAVVFGIERKWAAQFKDIYKSAPSWYEGRNMSSFDAYVLANAMRSFNSSSTGSITSRPSSGSGSGSGWSGGGGFSGGFSGGGGGGGGGGAW